MSELLAQRASWALPLAYAEYANVKRERNANGAFRPGSLPVTLTAAWPTLIWTDLGFYLPHYPEYRTTQQDNT